MGSQFRADCHLLEVVNSGPAGVSGKQLVIHTMWGGQLNRPYAMALGAAWQDKFKERLELFPDNDCIVLQFPEEIKPDEVLALVTAENVEYLLRKRLEGSGFFGARFRECAGRALLITRNKVNDRMPLWMTRLKSQKLLENVLQYDDFPILLETWRTCLQDAFDLDQLRSVLIELESGAIRWSIAHTNRPSPFASGMSWNQINKYMYREDQPASESSALRSSLLRDAVFSPGIRPTESPSIVETFEQKRQRLAPGYSPQTSRDLVDWVKERVVIPFSEWEQLMNVMENDLDEAPDGIVKPVAEKLGVIRHAFANEPMVVSLERMPIILKALGSDPVDFQVETLSGIEVGSDMIGDDPETQEANRDELLSALIGEWLRCYGPKSVAFISSTLGIESKTLDSVLEGLVDAQELISGQLITGGRESDVCDSENFESLLRMNRADAVPVFKALDTQYLALFLADFQGVAKPDVNIEGLFRAIEQLVCYFASAQMWETEIFPARIQQYDPSWLDTIMQEGDLRWIGGEKQKVAFCFESDLDLMQENAGDQTNQDVKRETNDIGKAPDHFADLFSDVGRRYDFAALQK
ncbi:MAG: hypothetical protein HKP58_08020 [Desulfatitalea sp.]|nr:hypothetical protein [Desulfatitalea sp.]NNK00346.1 hypothetical protein [Desulfatitalea sp.]